MASKKGSSFAALTDVLHINPGLADDAEFIDVLLSEVAINAQEREEFEDEDNSLADLGKSLRKQQLQPIVITPRPDAALPYLLVAGERRVRGATLEGLERLKAWVVEMTDEQVDDARFAENIQRKNLTQLEEARKLKRDVDEFGIEQTMVKRDKSRSWISKRIALLSLPPETSRLVTERISADPEVITQVATVEKRDPAAAAALVQDLKETRGKENAREKVAVVKAQVKPSTKSAPKAVAKQDPMPNQPDQAAPTLKAQPKPSGVAPAIFPPRDVLTKAYIDIFEKDVPPKKAVDRLEQNEQGEVVAWLEPFFLAGANATEASSIVAKNLRSGVFATDNEGWFALAAFLEGVAGEPSFDLLKVFSSAKG